VSLGSNQTLWLGAPRVDCACTQGTLGTESQMRFVQVMLHTRSQARRHTPVALVLCRLASILVPRFELVGKHMYWQNTNTAMWPDERSKPILPVAKCASGVS
jgi:hypothetical protein